MEKPEPMAATLPIEPMLRIEPAEPMERIEPADPMDSTDPTLPTASKGFYYLSRANNACGRGIFGIARDGSGIPNPACP